LNRRRRRVLLLLSAVTGGASLVVLTATTSDPPGPCEPPKPAPAAHLALMPRGLSFDGIGTITRVGRDELHVTVNAVTEKPLDEVTVLIQDAVTAAGYHPAGMDTEGTEAEVFFTAGPYAAGQAEVEQSPCDGRWDVELVLLDLDAAPPQATVPSKAA
jgi:hypothetical protein